MVNHSRAWAIFAPIVTQRQLGCHVGYWTLWLAGNCCRPDTVGQPPSAQNHASDMSSLKAQTSLESNAVTAAVSRGNRMTNSNRPDTVGEPSLSAGCSWGA